VDEIEIHIKYMREALKEAKKAYRQDEVPIGAVLVKDNREIIARGHNQPIKTNDPTAHAEIVVLRKAGRKLKNYRLNNTTIYVTVEPCPMCAGALVNARVKNIVYGCNDYKWGACNSVINIVSNKNFNHRLNIIKNILEEDCKKLIQKYFSEKRVKNYGKDR